MRRLLVCCASMAVLLLTASPVSAAAAQTGRESGFAVNGPFVDQGCGFEVDVTLIQRWTAVSVAAADGTPILQNVRVTEQIVLSANDVTLTSEPYRYTATLRFDRSGNLTSWMQQGVLATFILSDGRVIRAAGRLDTFSGDVVGHYDLSPVCAALS